MLAGVGSVRPDGAVIVAVFAREPVAEASTVAERVYVAVDPTARLMVSLIEPEPDAAHVAPAVAVQVQVAEVKEDDNVSATTTPTAAEGPTLEATIVYVIGEPGTAVVALSVLVMRRSAVGVRVSVSVAVLLAGELSATPLGTLMVAVLASVPVAEAATVAVRVKVAAPETGRFTDVEIEPEPLGAAQVPPAEAAHVQVAPVRVAGSVSVTVAPVTTDGPLLDATIVYVTVLPGIAVSTPSVLVMARSAAGARESVSLAVLFAVLGSVTVPGTEMLAVLVIVPVAVGLTVAVIV